jgi:hypothetical protein
VPLHLGYVEFSYEAPHTLCEDDSVDLVLKACENTMWEVWQEQFDVVHMILYRIWCKDIQVGHMVCSSLRPRKEVEFITGTLLR